MTNQLASDTNWNVAIMIFVCFFSFALLLLIYMLYKYYMDETPYQKTSLVEDVSKLGTAGDKKGVKKAKGTVRQRVVQKSSPSSAEKVSAKSGEDFQDGSLLSSKVATVASASPSSGGKNKKQEKSAEAALKTKKGANDDVVKETKQQQPSPKQQQPSPKRQAKQKPVKQAQSSKQDVVADEEIIASTATITASAPAATSSNNATAEGKQQQNKEATTAATAIATTAVVVATTAAGVATAFAASGQSEPQETQKKKKTKKAVEIPSGGNFETYSGQKIKSEAPPSSIQLVSNANINEFMEEEPAVIVTREKPLKQPAIQQQSTSVAAENDVIGGGGFVGAGKKKGKGKGVAMLDDSEVPFEAPIIQQESKQQKSSPDSLHQQHQQLPAINDHHHHHLQNKQQQQQLQELQQQKGAMKKLIEEKEDIIKRDQNQLKVLNDSILQMKRELANYHARASDMENTIRISAKKHAEEKQTLVNSLHQSDQQNKQAIQQLQQELAASKTIVTSLAEENAGLKDEMSRPNKAAQFVEELAQKANQVELLNASLRNTQIALDGAEKDNKSLKMKLKQVEDQTHMMEAKQNEANSTIGQLEKACFDYKQQHQQLQQQLQQLQQQHQQLQQQQQQQLQQQQQQMQQQQHHHAKIDEERGKMISQLEHENDSFLLTIEALKKEAKEREKVLTSTSSSPIRRQQQDRQQQFDQLIEQRDQGQQWEQQHHHHHQEEEEVQQQQQQNGMLESDYVNALKASVSELEKEIGEMKVKLEVKDKKNEDLRQKNWKAMDVIADLEKRLESLMKENETLTRKSQQLIITPTLTSSTSSEVKSSVGRKGDLVLTGSKFQKSKNRTGSSDDVDDDDGSGDVTPGIENVKEHIVVTKTLKIRSGGHIDGDEEDGGSGKLSAIMQQLEEQKMKNDDLRKKNWNIVVLLNEAEKKIQQLHQQQQDLQQQMQQMAAETSSFSSSPSPLSPTRRGGECGSVASGSSASHRREYTVVNKVKESCQWDMSQLVEDLDSKVSELHILQALLSENESAREVLKQENEELKLKLSKSADASYVMEEKVNNYRSAVLKTENTLKQLETSVSEEEIKWKNRIEELEGQVAMLQQQLQHPPPHRHHQE
ncbi:hypothetical protein HELRODRAFT_191968 [Helobdella robusta]|uniref:Ribosome receptor lysine/proline rich domain-containing protein n=1 Tax=Helobdella robusta TaxID=6412 RepID=T1FTG7_HELRO|nr:hypothetical protein HELRODRAFT_191968 [Helobdella robusta]ESO03813.1 hypothetical protein HELRODRAFT_191968 [Helobdella robusta]